MPVKDLGTMQGIGFDLPEPDRPRVQEPVVAVEHQPRLADGHERVGGREVRALAAGNTPSVSTHVQVAQTALASANRIPL